MFNVSIRVGVPFIGQLSGAFDDVRVCSLERFPKTVVVILEQHSTVFDATSFKEVPLLSVSWVGGIHRKNLD